MKYTIADIALIVDGELSGASADFYIDHLITDSRKVIFPNSCLFFCLKSNRRNAHRFIPELYQSGVKHFVVSEKQSAASYPGATFILVEETLAALQKLAAHHRKAFTYPVIGITGSNGKTIVKEWLNLLLENECQIVRSPASYNSQIGVPLSVWQMNHAHDLAIFEAGISQPGEMKNLQKMILPTIGIFTNIGEAHDEGFISHQEKVREKLALFISAKALVYNNDYELIRKEVELWLPTVQTKNPSIRLFSWSTNTEADLRILTKEKTRETTYVTGVFNGEKHTITIPFTDDASIENAITCWAVLLFMNKAGASVINLFSKLTPVAMRLEMKKGINNCSVINDSYNADISSLRIALDFLARWVQHPKKTLILSDLLETGKNEKELYDEIAGFLSERKIQRLIGIGPRISAHQSSFQHIKNIESIFFHDVDAFRKQYYNLSFDNEAILLKGARIFAFEQISHLLEQKLHQTILEIDQHALLSNLKQYQNLLKPETRIMAMVKAFSYGSGSFEIASLLEFHKVDYLAVAYADEGIELRKAGIKLPIMVLNTEPGGFDTLIQFKLEPVIFSLDMLKLFDLFLKKESVKQYPVHLEMETGMNRLGFPAEDINQLSQVLLDTHVLVQSVFSHLVASEDPAQDDFTTRQAALFAAACEKIQSSLGYSFLKHINNSAGISRRPDLQLDMVRLGIGLYGIDSAANTKLDLKEVSSLKTTIAQIKKIKKGDSVSYGRKGITSRDSIIATVRIGYADGYPRRLGNGKGKMLVNGQLAPVIGNICMDMTMLDITDIESVAEGDEVIVFGNDLPILQVAKWADTIPYEIMTGISQRVKRVYFEES